MQANDEKSALEQTSGITFVIFAVGGALAMYLLQFMVTWAFIAKAHRQARHELDEKAKQSSTDSVKTPVPSKLSRVLDTASESSPQHLKTPSPRAMALSMSLGFVLWLLQVVTTIGQASQGLAHYLPLSVRDYLYGLAAISVTAMPEPASCTGRDPFAMTKMTSAVSIGILGCLVALLLVGRLAANTRSLLYKLIPAILAPAVLITAPSMLQQGAIVVACLPTQSGAGTDSPAFQLAVQPEISCYRGVHFLPLILASVGTLAVCGYLAWSWVRLHTLVRGRLRGMGGLDQARQGPLRNFVAGDFQVEFFFMYHLQLIYRAAWAALVVVQESSPSGLVFMVSNGVVAVLCVGYAVFLNRWSTYAALHRWKSLPHQAILITTLTMLGVRVVLYMERDNNQLQQEGLMASYPLLVTLAAFAAALVATVMLLVYAYFRQITEGVRISVTVIKIGGALPRLQKKLPNLFKDGSEIDLAELSTLIASEKNRGSASAILQSL
jgi:hypothetical protein